MSKSASLVMVESIVMNLQPLPILENAVLVSIACLAWTGQDQRISQLKMEQMRHAAMVSQVKEVFALLVITVLVVRPRHFLVNQVHTHQSSS